MTSIKWENVVAQSVPVFKSFIDRGVVPTLRTIHYALVSKGVIPNTKSAYKGLSSALVDARKNGIVDWEWLADESRDMEEGESNYIWEPEDYANATMKQALRYMKESLEGSSHFNYPHWMNQEYYIEVWIEKSALRATFKNYLEEYKIIPVPSRGYSSWTFLKMANDRIQEKSNNKTPLIIYFGDFDPSGVDIERFLRESMNDYFGLNMEVIRIGVTQEQIQQYNLPTTPEDAEEIAKLQKDSRYNNWIYGNYRVELDALLAFVPDEFERIVKDSVANYFDDDVYDDVQEKERDAKELISKKLKDEMPQKIKDLMKELGLGDE